MPRRCRLGVLYATVRLRVVAVQIVVLLFSLSLVAQQPAASETVEVRLIELDAIVTDRKGAPVTGLGPEDFQVLENGRPQEITNFSEVRDGEIVLRAQSDAAGEAPAQPRTIAILVDALPLRGRERANLFADLHAIVEKTMREGDRGQVMTWHDRQGMVALTPMTFSRSEIIEALATAETTLRAEVQDTSLDDEVRWFREMAAEPDPQGGPRFDGEGHAQSTVRQAATRELAVMRRKTAAIQRILPAIAEPSRRNVLIYVSGSFPMTAGKKHFTSMSTRLGPTDESDYGTGPMIEAIARTANAHGVIIYALRPQVAAGASRIRSAPGQLMLDMGDPSAQGAIDPRDRSFAIEAPRPHLTDMFADQALLQDDVQALSLVARETGGAVAVGADGIKDAVERIARDLGTYYTLAYRTTADGSDRERHVELRSTKRSLTVRARRTILDRSDATRARDLLVARLFEQSSGGDIDFDIGTSEARTNESNQTMIPIELTIPVEQLRFEQEDDALAARFSVLAVAGANIGEVKRINETSRRIVVPAGSEPLGIVRHRLEVLATSGPTTLAIAVFDEKSGLAGVQSVEIDGSEVRGEAVVSGVAADDAWHNARVRAGIERKPILAWVRPARCSACGRFERETLQHPAIERRLSDVVFVQLPVAAGEMSKYWTSRTAGLGVFDRIGNFRLHFNGVPDTTTFGVILDDVVDIAPHLERAAMRIEEGAPDDAELDAAIAFIMLGRHSDARSSLERAIANGEPETRQYGQIARALIDAYEGKSEQALEDLDRLIADALTPHIAGEAWLTIGLIHRRAGENAAATEAFGTARLLLNRESRMAATSEHALAALESAHSGGGTIRIIPPDEQVVSGEITIRTSVASADVAAVAFQVDGVETARVTRPPFSTTIDFGAVPEQRTLNVAAFDGLGIQIGQDVLSVNEGGERFWFRLVEPRDGTSSGRTRVTMALRSPPTQTVERVTISWNDEVRAVVTTPPWETTVNIPAGELGVLRGVAQLSDGRSAEDAVLLNATGQIERAHALLVELPVTLIGAGSADANLSSSQIQVREGARRRAVDSIQTVAPLTVGLIIDRSGSMQGSLAEVQEAAISFLETVLAENDRAFLVSFATRATLNQPPTSDKALLRQQILSLRARGSTALLDAIAVGLLQMEGVKGRRALVVFTDGLDRTSRYTATDVTELARRTHVPIHLIAASTDTEAVAPSGSRVRSNSVVMYRGLSRMAESTGGTSHRLARLDNLTQVYGKIEDAIRSQFLIFVRTDPGSSANDWRNIKVDIATRGLTVHAPEGYYAPW